MTRLKLIAMDAGSVPVSRRAALYLRMSTDMQCYSLDNQTAALEAYALEHRLCITHTYSDAGRSGLTVRGRAALISLLDDVKRGADFDVLLIYDVSRWGRFQDPDEAAYYEHLCRSSGVQIIYCAELFDDDGTPLAALLKSIKRAMAAEFSRELSTKVTEAKTRLARKGYGLGGSPGYGLKRALFDEQGRFLSYLAGGEQKAVRAHRIFYVPGDPLEVALVQLIFWFYVERHLTQTEIAARLNLSETPSPRGTHWISSTVRYLLGNEKYVGNLVFGKVRLTLGGKALPNPPDQWIRVEGAIAPIIDQPTFDRAQRITRGRSKSMSKASMLERLRALRLEHGFLSGPLIDADPECPSLSDYRSKFGDLATAYAAVGWSPPARFERAGVVAIPKRRPFAAHRDVAT